MPAANVNKQTAAMIFLDLELICAQLGSGVACMIAAKVLHEKLQPGEWETIKAQLIPENIKNELVKLRKDGGQ
jgi:hypothetical protein